MSSGAPELRASVDAAADRDELLRNIERAGPLLDSLPHAACLTDDQLRIVSWNTAAEQLVGHPASEVIGRNIRELLLPPDVTGAANTAEQQVRLGRHWTGELPLVTASGQRLTALISGTPLFVEDGQVGGFAALAVDITEHVRSRQDAAEHAATVRSTQNLVLRTDLDGRITGWNPAAERLLGLRASEVRGRDFTDVVAPAYRERAYEAWEQVRAGFDYAPLEIEMQGRGDRATWVSVTFSPVHEPHVGLLGVSAIGNDVTESVRLRRELSERAVFYRTLVERASDCAFISSPSGRITYVAPTITELWGWSVDEVTGSESKDWVHPDDLALAEEYRQRVLATPGAHPPIEIRAKTPSGGWRWLELRTTNLMDDPLIGGLLSNTRDVTDRVEANAKLRASEQRYRSMIETAEEGIAVTDGGGRLVMVNDQLVRMLGTTRRALLGTTIADHLLPPVAGPSGGTDLDGLPDDVDPVIGLVQAKGRARRQLTLRGPGDEAVYVLASATPLPANSACGDSDAGTGDDEVLVLLTDITERVLAERELARTALYDPLTGLANRALLADRLGQALQRHAIDDSGRLGRRVAVIVLDVDNLGMVNDSLGHAAGDQLLQEVARRLEKAVIPGTTVARLAGDEFVVIVEDISETEAAHQLTMQIVTAVNGMVKLAGQAVLLQVTAGFVLAHDGDAETLLGRSSASLQSARRRRPGRIHALADVRTPGNEIRLLSDLRLASSRRQLRLYYQPLVSLRDGSLVGAEALLRWRHPQRGLLGPEEFLPLAESSGQILDIGRWVLTEACRQAGRLRERHGDDFHLAVNLSPQQLLADEELVEVVADALAEFDFPPHQLLLEVTENAVLSEIDIALDTLSRLKQLGVSLAIDDFGTGFSSLLYVQTFPIDVLKLDRTFVRGLGTDGDATAIVASVAGLARGAGVSTVAEGVEDSAQERLLASYGYDLAQGFLYSPPVPAAEFPAAARALVAASRIGSVR